MTIARQCILTLINPTITTPSNHRQATNPVTYLTHQGLSLTRVNNQLKLTPRYLVTKDIVQYINAHKETIRKQLLIANDYNMLIEQLSNNQQQWLADLVYYLGITPEYAIHKQIIIYQDIIEYCHQDPRQVADCLIKGGVLISAELKRN